MSTYFLGIDFGTGGAKACLIDEEANVLSYAFKEYKIITNGLGWSEHDPHDYWNVLCSLVKECIIKGGIDSKDIKAIGTSSALPSMVMVDANGNTIQNAYNLMDRRAIKQTEWIKRNIGEDAIFELTGNRLEDHPLIVNLMWERDNRPESFKRINMALTIDGYIRFKLTGKHSVNIPCAAFYGVAYDIRKHYFKQEVLDEIGISRDLLPEIYPCEEIIGEVTIQAARETGLAAGIPVAAGQADAPAGWMGSGAIEEGDTQMNLGTCGNFGVLHRDTNFLKSMLVCAHTVDCKNLFATIPTTTTGGQSLRYLRDQFSHAEVSVEKLIGVNAYDMLNMEAERVVPGSEGLIILPYLMGERTPIWDVHARGVVFGMSLNHGKAHFARAMMEAVAYAMYQSFEIIRESGKKIKYPIVLNEGGGVSRVWRTIITNVFNVPTVLVKSRVGAPFGDAILAAVATGHFMDYTITKEKAEYIDLIEPEEKTHAMYTDYFALYKKLYVNLKDNFAELAALRTKHLI